MTKKKKSVVETNLEDEWASYSSVVLDLRISLWQLVEQVERLHEQELVVRRERLIMEIDNPHLDLDDLDAMEAQGLPSNFGGSSNSKKNKPSRKRQKKVDSSARCLEDLPIFQDQRNRAIEHNVGYLIDEDTWFRVIGVGHNSRPDSETMMIEQLDDSGQRREVARFGALAPAMEMLHADILWQESAYEAAENAFWRRLEIGKPEDVHTKYWNQRYSIFAQFDRGVKLDAESWYSITFEAIAKHVARRTKSIVLSLGGSWETVLDCFSGCGGCTIALATEGARVLAVDIDGRKLDYLKHNCALYGQDELVGCIERDVWDVLEEWGDQSVYKQLIANLQSCGLVASDPEDSIATTRKSPVAESSTEIEEHPKELVSKPDDDNDVATARAAASFATTELRRAAGPAIDAVVLSPPWGGPDYLNVHTYDLSHMLTCGDGLRLVAAALSVAKMVVYIIPRNCSYQQLQQLATALGCRCRIENISVNYKCKVKVVHFY